MLQEPDNSRGTNAERELGWSQQFSLILPWIPSNQEPGQDTGPDFRLAGKHENMGLLATRKAKEEKPPPPKRVPALLQQAVDTLGEQGSKIPLIRHRAGYFYHSAYP